MNKLYKCNHCGQIIAVIKDSGVNVVCCGDKMVEIVPNTVEASVEKHVPVVSIDGNLVTVTVGSTIHPMTKEHYIEWIILSTNRGNHRFELKPDMEPSVVFALAPGEEVVNCYSYCNLHGLWSLK